MFGMAHKSTTHACIYAVVSVGLGVAWWWMIGRSEPHEPGVASRFGPGAGAENEPSVPAIGAPPRPGFHTAARSTGRTGALEKLTSAMIADQQALAQAQQQAVHDLPEADQPAALAAFAQQHRQHLQDLSTSQGHLAAAAADAKPAEPLPAALAAQARFAAVRRGIIDEAVSLEEAEARLESRARDP